MSNPTTIKGKGAPTMTTQGAVGQIYIDTDTGIQYQCVEAEKRKSYKVDSANYTWVWRKLSADFLATDEEVKSAMTPFIIDEDNDSAITGRDVKDALLAGRPIWIYTKREATTNDVPDHYFFVNSFYITSGTSSTAGTVIPIQSAGGSSYTIHLKYVVLSPSGYLIYKEYLCYVID